MPLHARRKQALFGYRNVTELVQIVAAGYAALLFAAVLGKLDSWRAWQETLRNVSPLPQRMTTPLLYGLPLVEGFTAIFILKAPKMGLAAAGALLCGLAVAVLALSTKHRGKSCSCFGALAPSEISPRLAGRNAMLASFAGLGVYGAERVRAESVPVGTVTITLLVALLVAISLQFYRFSRLAPGLRDG